MHLPPVSFGICSECFRQKYARRALSAAFEQLLIMQQKKLHLPHEKYHCSSGLLCEVFAATLSLYPISVLNCISFPTRTSPHPLPPSPRSGFSIKAFSPP